MRSFHLAQDLAGDLDVLVDTRLLVQANSGGGKSWALRRLLEQTHGRVQHLVIDPEGEFATLRERFDYVLAARQGGDTAADPRAARLLAERLLELGVSAVLDIYELKAHDRVRFVRQFLEALVDAPKKLWHPALVVVDEAHVYCPQHGEAESAGAVVDLATRGRKRGFCAVLATQRLSKLHKDAAAECNNKLIGRTGLDVDVKRAADELGFTKERWRELRELEAGRFFGFGPALSREVVALTVGPVQTTHPKAGARLAFTAPPPTAKVKALLPKLADLPAEAEERQRTAEQLQRRIRELEAAQRAGARTQPPVAPKRVEVPVLKDAQLRQLEKIQGHLYEIVNRFATIAGKAAGLENQVRAAAQEIAAALKAPSSYPRLAPPPAPPTARIAAVAERIRANHQAQTGANASGGSLTGPERKLLTALAQHGRRKTVALALLTGYAHSGGAFRNPLSALRSKGYVEGRETVQITDAGAAALGHWTPLPTGRALLAWWLAHLPGPEAKLLRAAAEHYPEAITVQDLAATTGYEVTGGAFRNPLSRLRTLQLVAGRSEVRAAEELFG